jgi:hypothetical protein
MVSGTFPDLGVAWSQRRCGYPASNNVWQQSDVQQVLPGCTQTACTIFSEFDTVGGPSPGVLVL